MAYAENTSVPIEKSKGEIESVLKKYGAGRFGYMADDEKAIIVFTADNRHIRFTIPMPNPDDFSRTPTGRMRKSNAIPEAYEQEVRRRWRALSLVIKAKLEAVNTGITEFEDEFLAHIVLPSGKTVAEETKPAIKNAYESGKSIPLLAGY
jgi:hypothetical protein